MLAIIVYGIGRRNKGQYNSHGMVDILRLHLFLNISCN